MIAVPATLLNVVLSVPVALRVRLMKRQRLLTTILVIPITLGTVMVAEGLLTYLGPRGWLNRTLLEFGLVDSPIRLVHNYWGVMLSLVITGFPFTFLLTLSYVTGIDPSLEQRRRDARREGARSGSSASCCRCWRRGSPSPLALSFVQAFTVFPSAVLLGAPAGPTRVISIAAYQAAFEQYDYSMASAIAMLMAGVQVGDHRGTAGRAELCCFAAPPAAARAEAMRREHRRAAVGRSRSGRWWCSSSSTCWR